MNNHAYSTMRWETSTDNTSALLVSAPPNCNSKAGTNNKQPPPSKGKPADTNIKPPHLSTPAAPHLWNIDVSRFSHKTSDGSSASSIRHTFPPITASWFTSLFVNLATCSSQRPSRNEKNKKNRPHHRVQNVERRISFQTSNTNFLRSFLATRVVHNWDTTWCVCAPAITVRKANQNETTNLTS